MTDSTFLIPVTWLVVGIALVLAWAIAFFWYRDRGKRR